MDPLEGCWIGDFQGCQQRASERYDGHLRNEGVRVGTGCAEYQGENPQRYAHGRRRYAECCADRSIKVPDNGHDHAIGSQRPEERDGEPLVARFDWHVDLIYTGKPNHGAVLPAVRVPDNEGMTGFGDRALAYDRLDSKTQALLSDLEVAYHFVQNQGQMRFCDNVKFEPGPNLPKSVEEAGVPDFPDAAYPAVGTHPVSGRKVLQIVPFFLNRVTLSRRLQHHLPASGTGGDLPFRHSSW